MDHCTSFDAIIINSYTHTENLQKTKELVESQGKICYAYPGDIGDYNFVKSMVEDVKNKGITIDLLINNAGISHVGLLTDMTIDDWNRILRTNLTSAFNCCKEIVPQMVSNKRGHIINISSMWGTVGASCEAAYSASKSGIHGLTRALAKELAPSGISVNAIACGVIDTVMNAQLDEAERQSLAEEIPAGRFCSPEEIAEVIWQTVNTPAYMTGQIIGVDGGYI